MTEEQMNIARRFVACEGWRWMPGMLEREWRVVGDGADTYRVSMDGDHASVRPAPDTHHIPDLDDPATLGCILALVREAWGDPFACSGQEWVDGIGDTNRWSLYLSGVEFNGDTEAAALLAALEAAP